MSPITIQCQSRWTHPRIKILFVDNGEAGQRPAMLRDACHLHLDVTRRPTNRQGRCWRKPDQGELFAFITDSAGIVVLPKHWVVERTHGCDDRSRHLVMDHYRRIDVSDSRVWLTGAYMLARRRTATV